MLVKILICVALIFYQSVYSAKILGLSPSVSKSHTFLAQALFKKLAERGHELTMVSSYPLKNPPANFRNIPMGDVKNKIFELSGYTTNQQLLNFNKGHFTRIKKMYDFGYGQARLGLEDPQVQTLIHSNETFDLVICTVFMNEAFFSLADHYKVPLIGFGVFGANEWTNNLVGNPNPYAIVPDLFLSYTEHMTFSERLVNTIVSIASGLWHNYVHLPRQEKLRQQFLPHTKPIWETLKDVSLVFLSSHPSLTDPRALVPNMIEIGGFHVDAPKSLPNDLQKTLDDAKDGVIYFSMGTNVVGKDLPESHRKALLDAFSKLKQTVLWKWEDDKLPGQPKNVKISKWYPQADLLAHPNIKLFITHGGLLSTTEAISRGVPLIGIPVFADQSLNMAKAQTSGYGIMVDYYNVTFESMNWALNEVLNNPKYTENVKLRSKVLNDRLVPPIEEAAYWVEYVLRHKGAPHLQSARKDLNIFQYLLLDILGFILMVVISICLLIYFVARKVANFFRKKGNHSRNEKKKQ
ncbi:UDP-glycosyltransferase UGT5-like [Chrysoperla carnea]|uniref:UDP-glycosyltransferase UGT5-like n=1 Tax=Chrysoperla carnea TaxID=189513 RepID=UPI001D08909B|nr:UDP-glycosyltransferase UGT5-like [Chrysoperla carnea]